MIIILFFVIAVLLALLFIGLKVRKNKPMVENNYWERVQTGQELEAKYMCLGDFAVRTIKFDVEGERWTDYTVWYPEKMESSNETFPLIVMANGTGVQNFKYEPVFEHLSSWGFIVIGNNDPSSGLGDSSSKSLDHILKLNSSPDSIFYNKIDINSIGIAGHSQGGVAAIHALYAFDNSKLYKAAYTASAATETMIKACKLTGFEYDISRVAVPILMVAGTGNADGKTISPLEDMKRNFDKIKAPAIIARRKKADHADMLYAPNGYMAAWFRYSLMDDEYAEKAFVGEAAELFSNECYQDVHSKLSAEY